MMIILFIDLQTIVNNQTELIQNIHDIFHVYLLSFPLAAYSIRDWLHHIIVSWCWSMSHNDTMRLQFGAFYSLPCQTEKHCHESSLVFYASSHFTIARSSRFFFSCCLPILLYSPLLLSSYFSALHSFICPQSSIIPCHYPPLLILFSFFLKSPWNFRSLSLVITSPPPFFRCHLFSLWNSSSICDTDKLFRNIFPINNIQNSVKLVRFFAIESAEWHSVNASLAFAIYWICS